LNTEYFIARKIIKGSKGQSRLSKPIVVISLASIIIGVAIMIISISVVTGFQIGIRDKVIGFGAHIQVTKLSDNNSMESSPVLIDQEFYPSLEEDEDVKKIQIFAYKPAILQSKRDSVAFELKNKDTIQSTQDILGVLFKGVDKDYDWDFFKDKLIEGDLINFDSSNTEIMISKYVSDIMGYKVGDQVDAFFIMDNGPKKRKLTVCGIYETGFEEFDKQLILTQIHHLQKLNNWGVQTYLTVRKDTCIDGKFVLKGVTKGGSGFYKYKWNQDEQFTEQDHILLNGEFNEEIQLISSDFDKEIFGLKKDNNSVPDTAYARIIVDNKCSCSESLLTENPVTFVSEKEIKMPFGKIEIENGNGTQHLYAGGFEILINKWDDLDKMDQIIYENIPGNLDTEKITEMHPHIFAWLNFLDINVLIIIILILVVSLINMITSLLVMILDKTNMIGILKSIGATNKSIRKIFLLNSLFLLSRGLFWGNILGVGLIALQYYTDFISLDPEVYYLNTVPVNFSLWNILFINILTILVCRVTLILPSLLISRIDPIKAIRFD
jgi:lipoprotein-releasing system permease protein